MRGVVIGLAVAALGGSGLAGQVPNPFGRSWLRVTAGADRVSDGYGDWTSAEVRAAVVAGPRDLLLAEARWQRAFGDRGGYVAGGLRHAFGGGWLATVTGGGGTGAFALPEARVDVAVHKTAGRAFLTVGGTHVRSKDVYRDAAGFASVAGYFDRVVLEGGVRINWSDPGAERSARGFGAVTVGAAGVRRVVIRGSAGRESYQLLAPGSPIRAFESQEGSLELEEWLGRGASLIVGVEGYHNPFYHRVGGRLGVARHW